MTNPNINPSSGLYARNPTHQEIAERSDDQNEIVKAVRNIGNGVKRMRVTYTYDDIDKTNPPPLSGITQIRSMEEEAAVNFCKNLMRSRPNIFKVKISLGDYPSARRIDNGRTRLLDSNKPRFHTELGELIGEIISDKRMLVTEIIYTVNNNESGYFNATGEVYGTTVEEYEDDKLFCPTINFEFIKTT